MKYLGHKNILAGFLAIFLSFVFATSVSAKLSAQDINKLRVDLEAQGATFTIGPNPATERDLNELCGLVPPKNWWVGAPFRDIKARLAAPSSWNWCDLGGCTPVKDQGSCGSCWAFGTVGPLESNILSKDLMEEDLSEQYLLSCNTDGWDCGGGWWAHDYHDWKYNPPETEAGAVPESEFPYVARDAPCGGPYSQPWKIDSWAYVGNSGSVPSVDAIKQAIMDYGPVAAAVYVGPAFQAYTGGVFNTNESGEVNHGIVLVGWDDTEGTNGVWILRNSWGPVWGENPWGERPVGEDWGYMRIEYGISQVGYSANYVLYSGTAPRFELSTPTPGPLYVCVPDSLQIQVDVASIAGFSDPVTLSLSGLPSGVDGSFDVNPVIPSGSSTLTLTIQASASPGVYSFDVFGDGGGQSDTLPLTLYVADNPPSPPSLIKPSDGEPHAGYGNVHFSWSSVPEASEYHLQVDNNSDFASPEADIPSIHSTSYILAGPLTQGETNYWRVSPGNGCGEGVFSDSFWFIANPKEILLVDDDDNYPDVRSYYEMALGRLGHTYDVWDTLNSDNEPASADLSGYEMVIWFTGGAWGGYAGPGTAGEVALANYLDSGGKLLITSQDYHWDKGLTPFMQTYLGVGSVSDDVGSYISVTGQNDFSGLGPFSLNYPFDDYSDSVTPGMGSVSFIGNNSNNAGVYTDNTVFFVFPWEAVANNSLTDGDQLLEAILSYLAPPDMVVNPKTDLDSSGEQGGPFSPDSATYRVTNNSDDPLDYSVSKTANWITLDDGTTSADGPLTGTLPPGGWYVDITVTIDDDANSLPGGTYSDTITFANIISGSGNTTRSVNLEVVVPLCECDLNHDGLCDMQDWLLFGEEWGRTDCCDAGVECECDLNGDCQCDMQDWLKFGEDWGRTDCPIPDECSGELYYDTGTPGSYWGGGEVGYGIAVRFTPPSYPWIFDLAKFWPYSGSETLDIEVHVWDDDGPGGLPGSDLITPILHNCVGTEHWEDVNLPTITIDSGEFYIGWIQTTSLTYYNGDDDDVSSDGRSYARFPDDTWFNFLDFGVYDNMMIRQGCQSMPAADMETIAPKAAGSASKISEK